jgi:hypothetical protein
MPVILATQEAEIRWMAVRSQPWFARPLGKKQKILAFLSLQVDVGTVGLRLPTKQLLMPDCSGNVDRGGDRGQLSLREGGWWPSSEEQWWTEPVQLVTNSVFLFVRFSFYQLCHLNISFYIFKYFLI